MDKPLALSSHLQFPSLDPEWAIDSLTQLEQTIAATMGVNLGSEVVKVTQITALSPVAVGGTQLAGGNALSGKAGRRRGLFAVAGGARSLASRGARVDFLVGVENPDRLVMMRGNLNRLVEGDPTLQQVFSSNLDKKLVLAGLPPVNLPPTGLVFGTVVEKTTTPSPAQQQAAANTVAPLTTSSQQSSGGAGVLVPAQQSTDNDASKPFFLGHTGSG